MRIILTLLRRVVGTCSGAYFPAAPLRVAVIYHAKPGHTDIPGCDPAVLALSVNQDGSSVVRVTVTWRGSNPSVVQIDEMIGLATAVAEGNAIISPAGGLRSLPVSSDGRIFRRQRAVRHRGVPGQVYSGMPGS